MNENQDPKDAIAGAAAMHPKSQVLGASAGSVTGAALGTTLGPLGTLSGALIGGAFGAVAGAGISEGIYPESEEADWTDHFKRESFSNDPDGLATYGPAFRVGWLLHSEQRTFEDSSFLVQAAWEQREPTSGQSWQEVIHAAYAGWLARGRARAK
jgi:hypothetical protein